MADRINNICAAAIRVLGGISSARNSIRPRRPEAESGVYSLSMQNSVRCALPVMSVRMLRNNRSVIQGGESVLPRLIDPGVLAGGTDELAAEHERQAGVVVPEAK